MTETALCGLLKAETHIEGFLVVGGSEGRGPSKLPKSSPVRNIGVYTQAYAIGDSDLDQRGLKPQ